MKKQHFVENKTEVMQHVLKMQETSLLPYLLLTSWSTVLLEKLTSSQSRNPLHFMGHGGSLPYLQVSYSEPNQSSPCPHIPLPEDPS